MRAGSLRDWVWAHGKVEGVWACKVRGKCVESSRVRDLAWAGKMRGKFEGKGLGMGGKMRGKFEG